VIAVSPAQIQSLLYGEPTAERAMPDDPAFPGIHEAEVFIKRHTEIFLQSSHHSTF
jgi:hypothetical protein